MRSRREFLKTTFHATGSLGLLTQAARYAISNPLGWPIGFQGYDVRFLLIKDWDHGWNVMRDMGYESVDLVSFKGYGYENSPLANLPAKVIRDKLDSVGIQCVNCQFSYSELHDEFEKKMEFSQTMRLKNVICAPAPNHMKTADDWKWQADQLNSLGERMQKAGFQLGYHNHDVEFREVNGQIPYKILMAQTEPKLVRFQIDVGNLTFGGGDALYYLKEYSDRYFSMHAKDYLPGKTSVPVGQGTLNWNAIFTTVKQAPMENYFAEVAAYSIGRTPATAWPTDSIDQLRQRYQYLHSLKV